jgi:eukaryotic-like serine/threonine-protein kinase
MHGRYVLYEALGAGGNASVHLGVARGETVPLAIKRLHDREAGQANAVNRLLDEVRLSRHIVHPNVVRVVDFVSDGEVMLAVMDYVHAEPLSRLLADVRQARALVPRAIAAAVVRDVLRGLQAAHEATDSKGALLNIVHRDVTPENVLVGADGTARITDFGVAKASGRLQATRDGGVRGKMAYLAPEQIGGEVTPRTDIYAAGLVLWEILVGERALHGSNEAEMLARALSPAIPAPSTRAIEIPPDLDAVVLRALAPDPEHRFHTAAHFATELERGSTRIASPEEVAAWVRAIGGERLANREATISAMLAAERAHSSEQRSRASTSRATPFVAAALAIAVAGSAVWLATAGRKHELAPAPPEAGAILPATESSSSVPEPSSSAMTSENTSPTTPSATRSPRPRAGRPRAAKCDPPWVLDAKGIRRYDPACIQ